METIIIHEKKSKAFRLGWTGLLMSAASIALLLFGIMEDRIIYSLIGVVSSSFYVITTIASLLRALKHKPLITITKEGIMDTASASSVGFIPFTAIESVHKVNVVGQKVLGIELFELETLLSTLPPTQQRSIRINRKMNLPPVLIRMDTADNTTLSEVYNIIVARHSMVKNADDSL